MKTRFVIEMTSKEKQELKRKTFELGFKTTKEFLLVAAEYYYKLNIKE